MSQEFNTTNVRSVDADYYHAKALALAMAVIGRLIAEGIIEVNFSKPDWHTDFKNQVVAAADVIHEFTSGGF